MIVWRLSSRRIEGDEPRRCWTVEKKPISIN
jgi:hypothetical protein